LIVVLSHYEFHPCSAFQKNAYGMGWLWEDSGRMGQEEKGKMSLENSAAKLLPAKK